MICAFNCKLVEENVCVLIFLLAFTLCNRSYPFPVSYPAHEVVLVTRAYRSCLRVKAGLQPGQLLQDQHSSEPPWPSHQSDSLGFSLSLMCVLLFCGMLWKSPCRHRQGMQTLEMPQDEVVRHSSDLRHASSIYPHIDIPPPPHQSL